MISPRNELEFVVRCRATKHPARICAVLQVGAAPAPRRVAGSLNRTSAIRLASEGGEARLEPSLTRLARDSSRYLR
jgi:hypothetical protein